MGGRFRHKPKKQKPKPSDDAVGRIPTFFKPASAPQQPEKTERRSPAPQPAPSHVTTSSSASPPFTMATIAPQLVGEGGGRTQPPRSSQQDGLPPQTPGMEQVSSARAATPPPLPAPDIAARRGPAEPAAPQPHSCPDSPAGDQGNAPAAVPTYADVAAVVKIQPHPQTKHSNRPHAKLSINPMGSALQQRSPATQEDCNDGRSSHNSVCSTPPGHHIPSPADTEQWQTVKRKSKSHSPQHWSTSSSPGPLPSGHDSAPVPGPPARDVTDWAGEMDSDASNSGRGSHDSSAESDAPEYWGESPPAKKKLFKTPSKLHRLRSCASDCSSSEDSRTPSGGSPMAKPSIYPAVRLSNCVGVSAATSTPALPTPEMAANTLKNFPELQALLALLPTKEDMRTLASDMRSAWTQDLKPVKKAVSSLQDRVHKLEELHNVSTSQIQQLQEATANLTVQTALTMDHIDDMDNRNRRNNIRIKGLPETVQPQDLSGTLQRLFNEILQKPADTPIELDRAHRALKAKNPDPTKPRDVICRVHHFLQKDAIMRKARTLRNITYNGTPVQLYPDLSLRTLRLRASLKPLLQVLQNARIIYKWGYPFSLSAKHGTTSATLRCPADLPSFLSRFKLPPVDLPDWTQMFIVPPLRPPEPQPATRPRPSNHGGLASRPPPQGSKRIT